MYILLVSRTSLHLFAIKSLKLPRVIETSTYKDLQHALRRILTWMPSTRFFSMLKKCLNLRLQPVIYLDLNYKHGHFFKFNTLVSRSKTTMTLIDLNYKHGHFFKFNTLVSRSKTTMTLIDSNYQQQ